MNKITVNRKEFINALSVGGAMAGKAKAMPILNYAKCAVKGDCIIMSSYDNDTAITKRLSGCQNDGGNITFCVDPKDVLTALKSMSDNDVTLNVDDVTMTIVHKRGELQVPTYDASEYPTLLTDDMGEFATVNGKDFLTMTKEAQLFISSDTVKMVLCGMYMRIENGTLHVAATDGRKLYSNSIDCVYNGTNGEMTGILRGGIVTSMLNAEGDIHICIGERNVYIKTFDTVICTRLIEGNYPNYKAIIPHNNSIVVTVDRNEIIEAARRVSIATDSGSNLLKIEIKGMTMTISGRDTVNNKKAKENYTCTVVGGGDITVGLSGVLLGEALNCIGASFATIAFADSTRPILVKDEVEPNKTIVLMPMRIE